MLGENENRVIIIGGGAAGMMAAIHAAENGADVLLVERNKSCGKKLRITGKGRCNVTNDCDLGEFLKNVPTNQKFLYSAFDNFSSEDTKLFFENEGVSLKVERGRRVFPVSDKAEDIVNAMVRACKNRGVITVTDRISKLITENGAVKGCISENGKEYFGKAVIIATGGLSYPLTGSDGDGYALAKSVGHKVTPLIPSLAPIVSKSKICPSLQGLSLKNVSLSVTSRETGKRVYEDFGEMMFTHFGMTGPMILSASAHLSDVYGSSICKYDAHIDLKPALDDKMLDARLISDFSKYGNRDFANSLGDLLPQKLIPVIISLSGISPHKKVNSITKEERHALAAVLKDIRISVDGFRPIKEAIITKGGVSVDGITPSTMESKLCSGLYFAGEVIDLDAYTGGFNLQIAFSTGALAGKRAAWS